MQNRPSPNRLDGLGRGRQVVRRGSAKALYVGSTPTRASVLKSKFEWKALPADILWYLVGVITSDGSLSIDGRHIDITSKDKNFLEVIKEKTGLTCAVGLKTNGKGQISYRLQFGSISFYEFLKECYLLPNKSKVLGKMRVPDEYFGHFFRGVLDGDGSIRKWKKSNSNYTQWYFKISSGSEKFLIWLSQKLEENFDAKSSIHYENYPGRACYILKVSEKASVRKILQVCYENAALALSRKQMQALECLA